MTIYTATSGYPVESKTLLTGDILNIRDGGIASQNVLSGGVEYVFAGGNAYGELLTSGSYNYVESGGVSTDARLTGGNAFQFVSAGGIAVGTVLSGTGRDVFQLVYGTADNTVISSNGLADVLGGTLSGAVIDGGEGVLAFGSKAVGTTISGAGSILFVSAGAASSGSIINSRGNEVVYGTADSARVNSGGVQRVLGSVPATQDDPAGVVARRTTVLSGGEQVTTDAVTIGTVLNGGTEDLQYGGLCERAVINSGGLLSIDAFDGEDPAGSAIDTTVNNGGREVVYGGVTKNTTINTGGSEMLSGGVEEDAIIAGGMLEIASGGAAIGDITFTGSGGVLQVDTVAGMPSGIICGFGPGDAIQLAGIAYSRADTVSVLATGEVTISAGGQSYTLAIEGATMGEQDFAIASGTTGIIVTKTLAEPFPKLASATIAAPETIQVHQGAGADYRSIYRVTLESGAQAMLSAGGKSRGVFVQSGSEILVHSAGAASSTNLYDGTLTVFAGGTSFNTRVDGGGVETLSGGLDSGITQLDSKGPIGAAGLIQGKGVITGKLADNGIVEALGGKILVDALLRGTGSLLAQQGAVIDLAGGGVFKGSLAGDGQIRIDAALILNSGAAITAQSVQQNADVTLGGGADIAISQGQSYSIAAASGTTVSLSGPGALTNSGRMATQGAGTVDIDVAMINNATVTIGSHAMRFLKTVEGTGSIDITGSAIVTLQAGGAATQAVDFSGSGETLALGRPNRFQSVVSGFSGTDKIDLLNTHATSLVFSGGKLLVADGKTTVASLSLNGSYTTSSFVLSSDHAGGTLIRLQP